MESLRFEGYWALATAPETRLTGTLRLEPDSGDNTLELIGAFKSHDHTDAEFPPLILGWTVNNDRITLFRTHRSQLAFGSSGIERSHYSANLIVVGDLFNNQSDLLFRAFVAHFTDLDEWAALRGVALQIPKRGGNLTVRYKKPEPVIGLPGPPLRVRIDTEREGPSLSWLLKDVEIHQKTCLVVEPTDAVDFEALLQTLQHLQQFVTLAVGRPVHVLSLRARSVAANSPSGGWVRLYPRWGIRTLPTNVLHPTDMLFPLQLVRERLPNLVGLWFEKRERLQPVMDLYFGTLFSDSMYLEMRFLSLAQALESYHRRMMNRTRQPKAAHKKQVKAVLENLPADQQPWVKDALQYSNEIHFIERLEDIYAKFPTVLDRYITDPDVFLKSVVATRNYRTHFGQKPTKWVVEDPASLLGLMQKMQIMLEACLLVELGLVEQQIAELLGRLDRRRVPPVVI
jgi:ApeA N-terminal domain 1